MSQINRKKMIHAANAPQSIGMYSQAVAVGKTVYISGQLAFDPETMQLIEGDIHAQIKQVFKNLSVVCRAAGGTLDDIVKLNVYLTNLVHFPVVNEVMAELFSLPYPARAAIGVAALPKGAEIEIDAIMSLE